MQMDAPLADPAALRQEAARLRSTAERLSAMVDRLDTRVQATEYQGPAADRFRAAMSDRGLRGRRAASELSDAAELVQQAAARAEQEAHRSGSL
jgi:hypothetical protein